MTGRITDDPFTAAFAKRLYERQNGTRAPAFDTLGGSARESWLKHAEQTSEDFGHALVDVIKERTG